MLEVKPSSVSLMSELLIMAVRPSLVRTSKETVAPPRLELRLKK